MKKIYLITSFTGTILSRIVRAYTQNNHSHVSISLDKELNQMYSFGRLNPYNAFIGGLVHEHPKKGTFKRFKNTTCEIYELEITDNQYKSLEYHIKYIEMHKKDYKFNIKGLFATSIQIKIKKEYQFYCAEFVKYVLEKSNIDLNLPDLIKPQDFTKIEGTKKIYEGLLREYYESN